MRHLSLEIPLRPLALARSRQRHDTTDPRVEPLSNPLDSTAFAGGIAPLKDDNDLELAVNYPILQLDQLALQPKQLPKIEPPVHGVRGLGEQLGESLVVELHFQLFVNAVENFAMKTVVERILTVLAIIGHIGSSRGLRQLANRPRPRRRHESQNR